jgi:hypothetical protein
VIAEGDGVSLVADLEPLPGDLSPDRLRRGLLRLGGLVAIAVVVVTLGPGLGELRRRFADAQPVWIVIACAFEVLSVLAYVPAFRAVFCRQMSWFTSYKIGVAEEGAGSLFPLGGAGSLALGVWALRRGGMPAAGAIAATLGLRRLARGAEARVRRQGGAPNRVRVAAALSATSEGIDEALHQLRRADPLLLAGLVGYLVFDQLTFWASFRAVGASPELPLIWMAYLIGQLGNWLPLPGGIGGVELGLVGALVLYGLPALTATAAVLLYRVIELWIPAVLGISAFVQLRLLLRREAVAIKLCKPGDTIKIVGLGPKTIDQSGVNLRVSPASAPVVSDADHGAPE